LPGTVVDVVDVVVVVDDGGVARRPRSATVVAVVAAGAAVAVGAVVIVVEGSGFVAAVVAVGDVVCVVGGTPPDGVFPVRAEVPPAAPDRGGLSAPGPPPADSAGWSAERGVVGPSPVAGGRGVPTRAGTPKVGRASGPRWASGAKPAARSPR
jgi:hypothetical protein